MTAEEKRAYNRDYYQRKLKGSAKQKERRRKLWAKQKMRGWQCEQVEGFRMTATNGTIFIEIGGDRNGD